MTRCISARYNRTKDILYVMKLPPHKSINNTLVYMRASGFIPFLTRLCRAIADSSADKCEKKKGGLRGRCRHSA